MDSPVYVQMNSPFLIESKKLKNIYDMSFFHYHNAYEIYYQIQGERNYFIENKVFYIRKGDVIFIKMNDLHRSLHCPKTIFTINASQLISNQNFSNPWQK